MVIVKLHSHNGDVKLLQKLLHLPVIDGIFGDNTNKAVIAFQKSNNITADGIVGQTTWSLLIRGIDDSFILCAHKIGCELNSLKAIKYVESGNTPAFISSNTPSILFEGHVFWRQLVENKINPLKYVKGNEDILYKSWTTKWYLGGINEYKRLNKAIKINKDAALKSASWGMFQILGANYKQCGCSSIDDFVSKMKTSEGLQLNLFTNFILSNSKLRQSLVQNNWSVFASIYNGPSYKQNNYDVKLESAYKNNC